MTLEGEALVFARCLGFVSRAPGFSNKAVPGVVRASFAFLLTLLLAPTVTNATVIQSGSIAISLIGEIAIGATFGFACALLYNGIDAGAAALDDFVGIRGMNPTAGPTSGYGIARLWSFVFTAMFFILGGYILPLTLFADTLRQVPPGAMLDPVQWRVFVTRFPSLILQAAIIVAGPALCIGMVAQFALSAIARIVPRFSVQAISFGVTFTVVLLVTIVSLPLAMHLAGHPWIPLPLPGLAMPTPEP